MSTVPRIVGHRGAAEAAPENTLAGIREAARQGAGWVELDVMLSADGVPVLIHDETLERTTDGRGAVAETPAATLGRLDAGSWFAARFAGEPVPALDDALALILRLGLGLNLEIKPAAGRDEATAEAVAATLARVWPAHAPLLLSSFSVTSLLVARDRAPAIRRGLLLWDAPDDWAAVADRVGASTLNVAHDRETEAGIAAYRASGRPVLAYTVNDAARARILFGWGVAGIITDAPGRMAAALGP